MASSAHLTSSPPPIFPDFTTLAERLQETAHALLEFSRAHPVAEREDAEDAQAPPEPASKNATTPFEIRSYKIPNYILHDEQELLKITDTDGLLDV